jgi:hypothetical protein
VNWLEFFANIIDNVLSWPVAVLLIVLLLRKQLRELFRTVENFVLEAGGTKFSLTRNLETARESLAAGKAEALLPPTKSEASSEDPESVDLAPAHKEERSPPDTTAMKEAEYLAEQYSHTWKLARKDPSYAIEVAWDRLIAEQVRRSAHDRGLPTSNDTFKLLIELNSRGLVNDDIVRSVRNLNVVRRKVAFAEKDPSPNEALEYVDVAWEAANVLSFLRSEDAKSQSPQ